MEVAAQKRIRETCVLPRIFVACLRQSLPLIKSRVAVDLLPFGRIEQ